MQLFSFGLIVGLSLLAGYCHTDRAWAQNIPNEGFQPKVSVAPVSGNSTGEKFFLEYSGKYRKIILLKKFPEEWLISLRHIKDSQDGPNGVIVIGRARVKRNPSINIEEEDDVIVRIPDNPSPGQAGVAGENQANIDLMKIRGKYGRPDGKTKKLGLAEPIPATSPPGTRRFFYFL